MAPARTRRGVYISYNEVRNGPFQAAVDISNSRGYVIWAEKSVIEPEQFDFPTLIVVRLKGQERYYEGILWAVKGANTIRIEEREELLSDENHPPPAWRAVARKMSREVRSVLYIAGLKEAPPRPEVRDMRPPQRPAYPNFDRVI